MRNAAAAALPSNMRMGRFRRGFRSTAAIAVAYATISLGIGVSLAHGDAVGLPVLGSAVSSALACVFAFWLFGRLYIL